MKIETLCSGLFPTQLPPAFIYNDYVDFIQSNSSELLKKSKKLSSSKSENFSYPRSSFKRRFTKIVNPIGYFFLCDQLVANWPKIEKHLNKSKYSCSKVSAGSGEYKRLNRETAASFENEKLIKSSGYPYALITDILNFYPNVYTHSIPWALHSKAAAKSDRTDRLYGNTIDKYQRKLQDDQTIGIPIGPDSSELISEIMGAAIDAGFAEEFRFPPPGCRFFDDYYLFFDNYSKAEQALTKLITVLNSYELQINAAKTRIVKTDEIMIQSWPQIIKENASKIRTIGSSDRMQQMCISRFFEELFQLDKKYNNEDIITYGLTQIGRSMLINENVWPVFESYILKCGYTYPKSLHAIIRILTTYAKEYDLGGKAIKRFCENLIYENAQLDHHFEVAWLLMLAKTQEIKLSDKVLASIISMSGSVCHLMAYPLCRKNVKKEYNQFIDQNCTTEALDGPNWLLAYEAGRMKWVDDEHITNHLFFNGMLNEDVAFFDYDKTIRPLWKRKLEREDYSIDNLDFDDVEYDEEDDNYFDFSQIDDDDDNDNDSDF